MALQDGISLVQHFPLSRLASDAKLLVQVWEVSRDTDGQPAVQHLDTLVGHSRTVNVVRFSPGGDLLASGVRTRRCPKEDARQIGRAHV